MDPIPITSLTPESAPPSDKSIRAIVTLSWPYSSSTRQCALLLADPDFRLRNRKGQVRVRFTGASAEAVVKAHVGIGDDVVLALSGASWEQDSEATRTPGKSVDGELMFRRRLALSVVRAEGNVEINVDAPVSPPRSPEKPVETVTPLPKTATGLRSSLDGTVESLPSYTYTSPAFAKRLRLSGESVLNSAYDPFAVEGVDMQQSNERNWTSFGSNLKWRYTEKTPSPKKVHFRGDDVEDEGRSERQESPQPVRPELESPLKDTRSKTKILPPPLPNLQMPASKPLHETTDPEDTSVEQQEGPSTPKIRPVHSQTLPMPSPFPMDTRQVQFGLMGATTSAQDRSQEPTTLAQSQAEGRGRLVHDGSRDEDVEMLDQHADVANEGLQEYLSDTEPDDELTQQTLLERHGVIVYDETVRKKVEVETIDEPSHASHEDEVQRILGHYGVKMPTESMPEMPRTPERAFNVASQVDFGLDGTSSAPLSVHATPQSEKEKIMAQTYRSLFGFRDSPEPPSQLPQRQLQQQEPESFTQTAWFSDMARGRLEGGGFAVADHQKGTTEEAVEAPRLAVEEENVPGFEEQRIPSFEEQYPGESASSARPSQKEVIDLASSSEGEDDSPRERAPVPSVPQRRIPKLEIQDSLADPEGEDLLAQDSQALRGRSGIRERRAHASKLQEMIIEEPRMGTTAETSQPTASIEGEMSNELSQDVSITVRKIAMEDKAEPSGEVLASSPLSSHPPEMSETLSSPTNELQMKRIEKSIDLTASSPLSSRPPYLSEVATSPLEEPLEEAITNELRESFTERQTPPYQEPVAEIKPTESTAPATVIELGSSSPVRPPEPNLVGDKAADIDILEDVMEADKLDSFARVGTEEASPKQRQSEIEMKSPRAILESPMESKPPGSQAESIHFSRHTVETPLYPNLPLNPSNSQSLQEMPSQRAAGTMPETMPSTLPPTPQLTQVESFTETHAPPSSQHSSSQLQVVEPSSQLQEAADEELMSQPQKGAPAGDLSFSPQVGVVEPSTQSQVIAEEEPTAQPRKKTPARKSLSTRHSNVPDVISAWFSPKRSSSAAVLGDEQVLERRAVQNEAGVERTEMQQLNGTAKKIINGHVLAQSERSRISPIDANGFSTAFSYFTPLSRLEELLNPSSQQAHGTNTIDVIAVVTDRTKEPVRAKSGPRDYFTIFKVSDQSFSGQSNVRVEIYRPWMATLPVASVGDVILLREFAVKSRKRQPYLLSTDASAWCLWRHGDSTIVQDDNDGKPIWARKRGSFSGGVREEIKGPPIELGDEERGHATRLREWWQAVQFEDVRKLDSDDMPNDRALNGHVNEPVAAKL